MDLVISGLCSIHFTVTLARLKDIIHYIMGGLQGSLNQGLLHQGPTVLEKGPPYLGIGGYVKDHQSFVVNLMAKF